MIDPINELQQQEVLERVEHFIANGEQIYSRSFKRIPVLFDLKGRTAGMYRVRRREKVIRFNPWLFSKYYADSLAVTVPHEVAHYLADVVYGLRNIRPHGREWQAIMAEFGADASVTTRYSLDGIPTRQVQRFAYRCLCRGHELTSYRHQRILKGQAQYRCRSCGSQLQATSRTMEPIDGAGR